uniref:Uncharacterized protein n=1 Tax=Clastoptera arizonana TaxID=38151 RepID=A0A1B6CG99_9HEMI
MNFLESNISQRLMVSENGMPPRADSCPQFRTRKMADIAVQVDPLPQEEEAATTPDTTRTVVEINNSDTETTVTPTRPLSAEFINSIGRERRRTMCEDMDEIVIQHLNYDEAPLNKDGKTEVDGYKEIESSCCIDCIYYSMKCCECTIM